jgi:hypothetical protein
MKPPHILSSLDGFRNGGGGVSDGHRILSTWATNIMCKGQKVERVGIKSFNNRLMNKRRARKEWDMTDERRATRKTRESQLMKGTGASCTHET